MRTASGDFERLIADVEHEAIEEGPQAVWELERLRAEFKLAGEAIDVRRRMRNNLGNNLDSWAI